MIRAIVLEISVACLAVTFLVAPFYAFLTGADSGIVFGAIASDTYYYAEMARQFTQQGFFSFDGETVSNGFMPLWQLMVTGLDLATFEPGDPPVVLIHAIFIMSLITVSIGTAILTLFVTRRYGSAYALIVLPLLVPGAVFYAFDNSFVHFIPDGLHAGLSAWSFVNGMESGGSFVSFALLLPLAVRLLDPETATRRIAVMAGSISFLAMMARLDDVFIGLSLGILLLTSSGFKRPKLVTAFAVVPILGSAVYLLLNFKLSGSALPVSGLTKMSLFGFPNNWNDISTLYWALDVKERFSLRYRFVPVFLSIFLGTALFALTFIGKGRSPERHLVRFLSLYILLKGGFLFFSVEFSSQGWWYYTNIFAALNVLAVSLIWSGLARRAFSPVAVVGMALGGLVAVLLPAAYAASHLANFRPESFVTVQRDLCTNPQPLQDLLASVTPEGEVPKIVDTGDGVYAFCTGVPALSLTGLVSSVKTIEHRQQAGFMQMAIDRGHDLIVASTVRWASYDWRSTLTDNIEATLVGRTGGIEVWRLSNLSQ